MSQERYSSWLADEMPPKSKRGMIVFQGLVFVPLAVVMGIGVAYSLSKMLDGEGGHIVMLIVTGIMFLVFAFQALHYLKDMGAEPMSTEGEVTKKWSKANLFFFFLPSFYIAVKGNIYTITRDHYRGILEEDMVRIRHYPNTLTVEHVERYDEVEKKFVRAEPDVASF